MHLVVCIALDLVFLVFACIQVNIGCVLYEILHVLCHLELSLVDSLLFIAFGAVRFFVALGVGGFLFLGRILLILGPLGRMGFHELSEATHLLVLVELEIEAKVDALPNI